ncbi:hypothetical protein SAMN05216436_10364 [bacterium A37T11]|nr:hypothetical protein SAMN05216436_10364 [bacterium A37T11]
MIRSLLSGVLNVTRLTPFYTPGAQAQFVEEAAFRMIIPLVPTKRGGITDTVTDTVTLVADKINELLENQVSKQVGERLARIVLLVRKHPGMRSNSIAKKIAASEVSIRRDMQKLKDIVSFSGAPRSGGYYLSKKFEDVLDTLSYK